ncbi:hypothetical protein TSUD_349520 [Trifolium subterraneum]|uniref:Uncharacterized protein n=1 Tax=Trifolium subterraneum TaxID=3900 RepID=A0A2Z6P4G9_TRISU|nr:hypothetical protein TSUD_349520 [Trifolium subterraneum]
MNHLVRSILTGAGGFIGNEGAKLAMEYGSDLYNSVKGAIHGSGVSDDGTLEFELSNSFYNSNGFGNIENETKGFTKAVLNVQQLKFMAKLGCFEEATAFGIEFPMPGYSNVLLGMVATSAFETNPALKFKCEFENPTKGLQAVAELSYFTRTRILNSSIMVSSLPVILQLSKLPDNIEFSSKFTIEGGYYNLGIVKSSANTDVSIGFGLQDVQGFSMAGYGTMTIAGEAKPSRVGAEIRKVYKGVAYKIKADCNTDRSGGKVGFGWSTST